MSELTNLAASLGSFRAGVEESVANTADHQSDESDDDDTAENARWTNLSEMLSHQPCDLSHALAGPWHCVRRRDHSDHQK